MTEAYTVTTPSLARKIIAARVTQAKQAIPHFGASVDVEVEALLELRKQLRRHNPDAKLSLNDLLIKACAAALMDAPAINIQWLEGEIRQYHTAQLIFQS